LAALLIAQPACRSVSQQAHLDVDEFLWWLPSDTETLQVTSAGLKTDSPLVDSLPWSHGEFRPQSAPMSALRDLVRPRRFRAVIEGARHFRAPTALGGSLYEGASIFVFDEPFEADALTAGLRASARRVETVQGLEAAVFEEQLERDIWTWYVVIPAADVVVVATDVRYLEELLGRRSGHAEPRALPSNLPEWRWVKTSARYWGLRHIAGDAASAADTPEFMGRGSGLTVDVEDGGTGLRIHHVSGSISEDDVRDLWSQGETKPVIRRAGAGAVEVTLAAPDEESAAYAMFVTFGLLGHAVFL
jgi:hypothetical protein